MSIILAVVHDSALQAILAVALIAAFGDWAVAVLASLKPPNTFKLDQVAQFLSTHVASRVLPVVFLAFLASALSSVVAGIANAPPLLADLPAGAWVVAWTAIATYLGETFASLESTVKSSP